MLFLVFIGLFAVESSRRWKLMDKYTDACVGAALQAADITYSFAIHNISSYIGY